MSHGKCDQSIVSSTPILSPSTGNWRLDSWKEIAVYVRREVRTVQRWRSAKQCQYTGIVIQRATVRKRLEKKSMRG